MVFNSGFRNRLGFVVFLLVSFAFLFAFVGFASALSTPGNISSCQELDAAGNYFLNVSLINENVTSSSNGCFYISASDVVLDCQNYFIRNTSLAQSGIYASNVGNITIQNCNVTMKNSGNSYGVYFNLVSNSLIVNSTANSNGKYGIYLSTSSNNTLTSIISNSNPYGIYLGSSSNNTLTSIISNSNSYGIFIGSSSNNIISNANFINNTQEDLSVSPSVEENCNLLVSNVNGTDNKPIVYYNYSVNIQGWNNNVSAIILCNADNSVINNVNLSHIDKNNGIYALFTDNSTFSNINSNSNKYGIFLYLSSNNTLRSIISNSNSYGIGLYTSSNNTLTSITSINNSYYGLGLSTSSNNTIYNNFFNETTPVYIAYSKVNYWNTTLTSGTNIIGGQNMGGNFYANSSGTGYSEICTDIDKNGICDNALTFDENNADYLSLSFVDILSPLVTITTPTATTYTSGTIAFNVSLNENGNVQFSLNGGTANYTMSSTDSRNFNYSYSGLTSEGYTFKVYANDSSGNRNDSVSVSFTVSISSGSSSSSSGGGGGGGGGASASTYSLNDKDFTNGITKDLQLNDKFKINITENHYVTLTSLGLNLVGINVSSKTQEATLSVGETRNFDVNEDGQYELSVTLEKIGILEGVIKNATISVKKYTGEVILQKVVSTSAPKEEVKKEVVIKQSDESNNNLIWTLLTGIAVVLIVIYFIWKKKSRGLIGKVHVRHGHSIVVK